MIKDEVLHGIHNYRQVYIDFEETVWLQQN
jgi:hypothetical protein